MTASTMESGIPSRVSAIALVSNLGFLLDFREMSPKGDLIDFNVEAFIRFT